jgi:hypothetical protein
MSLYVASHYKNSPNDLILMSDAPAHHLFALLGPVDETQNALPDVLAVVQVALEGEISKRSAQASLAAGQLPQVRLPPLGQGSRRRRCCCLRCFQGVPWPLPTGPPQLLPPAPATTLSHTCPPSRSPLPPAPPVLAWFCRRET